MYKKIVGISGFNDYFWPKVDFGGRGCWEWTGALSPSGYGACAGRKAGLSQRSHRAAWQAIKGEIPDGLLVCHHCDNRKCCRISHMFLGTCADNHADRNQKNRQAKWQRNGRAKLSDEQVVQVRGLISRGLSDKEIAERFPIVTSAAIWQIRKGGAWRGC